jgi:hypothetical protein
MNEDKKIKIFSQNWWWGHQERKNKFKDYSPKNWKQLFNFFSTNSFKIINGILK